jgi:hypothetical protein
LCKRGYSFTLNSLAVTSGTPFYPHLSFFFNQISRPSQINLMKEGGRKGQVDVKGDETGELNF